MGKEYEEARVIKPPGVKITSGRVFRPSKALRNKMWFSQILVALIFYGLFLLFVGGVGTLIGLDDPSALLWLHTWWLSLNIGMWIFNLIWLIPAWILTPLYVSRIEYSVIAESGETMPEVYVRKGIISITRKHVPFRTITNISTTAGPFDRIFGIGNVNIETAGYSGQKMGPEEKLEGFEFYEELRDFILQELRKFRAPYVTGTEVVSRHEKPVPGLPDRLDDEILLTLREMRKILLEIAETLKKR
ncbi:MAG: PH domain-containing protein [Candidatus Hermodarchaeota archaeon]|nr:PH domain-containing protein [Candidatus Hermodarchaeota archaeon]